ncbi:MAG: hypothetical protein PHH98_01145 [Candidatus Gracilibacteria bacterium]|nr:hypothetical protein [Candidatus Gracilibacteria bacterium]
MLKYIEGLGNNPSPENLKMVEEEISIANDIIMANNALITELIKKGRNEAEDIRIKELRKSIVAEELFIKQSREIAEKIVEVLGLRR